MKRPILAIVILLAAMSPAFAQDPNVFGNISASTPCPGAGCVTLQVTNKSSVSVDVRGTWTGTLTVSISSTGSNFVDVDTFPISSINEQTSINGNGMFVVKTWSAKFVRISGAPGITGTAQVTLNAGGAVEVGVASESRMTDVVNALESLTGMLDDKLTSINAKTPALGQALAANSTPVVLPAAQITTLTPPAAITGFALDATLTNRTQKTQITDGTNDATVKPASTAPLLTDKALVTTQRDPLPEGTNVIGHTIADSGSTTVVTGNVTVVQPTGTNLHVVNDAGTAVIGHVIADSGSTTAVTGTVTVGTHDVGSITTAIVPGTGATNLGKAEDAAHTSGDVGVMAMGVRKDTNSQTTSADGDYAPQAVDAYGSMYTRVDHPNRFRCTVTVSTATTIQAVGGSCATPGAGLSLYITDIEFSASASGIAADAFPTLKYGTGGTCGTGTTVFWGALTAAAIRAEKSFAVPLKIPANNEVCWITSTAGSKFIVLSGFIAP